MEKEILVKQEEFPWLDERTILLVEVGSLAHGTNLPTSDRDLKGICIPPIEYHLGLQAFEQYQPIEGNAHRNTADDTDVTIYGLKKFVKMAMNGNPNVLELLFTKDENILYSNPEGDQLRFHRELFLSNRITESFGGNALQHRKRLERGLKQRKELVEQFGYDTKTFAHAVRLYEMAIECFQEGTLYTHRSNAEELKAIRNGLYSFEEAMLLLDKREIEFQQARKESVLPDEPDLKRIETVLIELTLESLREEIKQ